MARVPIAPIFGFGTDVRESDIFISHGFDASAFVSKLEDAIKSQKLQIWKDFPVFISPNSPEAWQYVAAGIEHTRIFVFVSSPDAVDSRQNLAELELAVRLEKHLILIDWREVKPEKLPQLLHQHPDWIKVDSLAANPFELIAKRINQLHIYTRLADKAAEWDAKKRPHHLLLGKKDLESIRTELAHTGEPPLVIQPLQREYLDASAHEAAAPQVRPPDVLISYSRKDKTFVERLCKALRDHDITFWVDWENIPIAAPWREELAEGIKTASNFLFIMSPDSVDSKYCYDEIQQASTHNKRIITIVLRKDYNRDKVHAAAKERNWLYLDQYEVLDEKTFSAAIHQLLEAIKKDEDYVKTHTRLLLQALEWDGKDRRTEEEEPHNSTKRFHRRDHELLLTGTRLKKASQWLAQSTNKEPQPTALQRAFIQASQNQQKLLQWRIVGGCALASMMAIFITSFALNRTAGEINALVSSLDEKQELDALMVSLKAGKNFEGFNGLFGWFKLIDADARPRLVSALNKSVYNLHEINRLEKHSDRVYRAIFSHDGKLLASASQDGNVNLWKPDGKLIRILTGHAGGVASIAFAPDDQILVSGSYDGTVKLWDMNRAQTNQNPLIKTLFGHSGAVFRVEVSPDGQLIASAGEDATVQLWTKTGEKVALLQHNSPVSNLSFSANSQQLVSASEDGVQLWSSQNNFQQPKQLSQKTALFVTFSPDGSRIVASEQENIQLWDQNGQPIATLAGHQEQVNAIVFSADSQRIASVSKDNTVRLWTREGRLIKVLRGHQDVVWRAQFSPDNSLLATADASGIIKLWDAEGKLVESLERHRNDIWDINFSPDSQTLVSAGADSVIKLWRPKSNFIQPFSNDNYGLDINASPNSQFVASSSFYTIKFWKPDGTPAGLIGEGSAYQGNAHKGEVQSISISRDGKRLASSGEDGKLKLWTLTWESDQLKKATPFRLDNTTNKRSRHITSVAFSPDSQQLISAVDEIIQLWQVTGDGGTLLRRLEGTRGVINSVSFSADGEWIVAGSNRISSAKPIGEVALWKTDGSLIDKLESYRDQALGDIYSVALSPDKQFLAAADSSDSSIKLWQLQYGHRGSVAVTPFKILEGHDAPVFKVAFSPDGKLLASAGQDGLIKLWSVKSGELISTLRKHVAPVSSISFSPDGKTLYSTGYDTKVLRWQITDNFDKAALENLIHQGCSSLNDFLENNQAGNSTALTSQAKDSVNFSAQKSNSTQAELKTVKDFCSKKIANPPVK